MSEKIRKAILLGIGLFFFFGSIFVLYCGCDSTTNTSMENKHTIYLERPTQCRETYDVNFSFDKYGNLNGHVFCRTDEDTAHFVVKKGLDSYPLDSMWYRIKAPPKSACTGNECH